MLLSYWTPSTLPSFRKHRRALQDSLFISLSLSLPLIPDSETRDERGETPGKVSVLRLITLPDPIVDEYRVLCTEFSSDELSPDERRREGESESSGLRPVRFGIRRV